LNAVYDYRTTPANGIVATTLAVSLYTRDSTPPMLTNFAFVLDTGSLTLNFDEVVDAATLSIPVINLQSASGAAPCLSLLSSTSTSTNGFSITVILTTIELNTLKATGNCFTNQTSSFISASSLLIKDMAGNAVVAIANRPAFMFTAQTIRPMISSFNFDLGRGLLNLTFTETVRVNTMQPTSVTMQSSSMFSGVLDHHTLTGGQILTIANGIVCSIQLSITDLNALKVKRIAASKPTTWMTFHSAMIMNMAGLSVIPAVNGVNAQPVMGFIGDPFKPELSSFNFSANTGTLTLSFNEAILISSLSIPALTLQFASSVAGQDAAEATYTLTASSTSASVDGPVVVIVLSNSDLNAIKQRPSLAVTTGTTFISITDALVTDIANNPVVAIASSSALPVTMYVPNTTPPQLTGFDFNMNAVVLENGLSLGSAELTLYFSQTVNVSTLNPTAITIQNRMTSANSMVTLTGMQLLVTPLNRNFLTFKLLRTDANAIKAFYDLAKNSTNTFLSFTSSLIRDMSGNVNAVSAPLSVTTYTKDLLPPILLTFDINMNTARLSLTFDETVDGTTIMPTEFTLQDGVVSTNARYMLTGGVGTGSVAFVSGVPFAAPATVTPSFGFTYTDTNIIKGQSMCKSGPDCFLINTEYAVRDMAGNKIIPCS